MKVNRCYTMELRTLELLARKKNKSLIVNLAVRQYMKEELEFSLGDIPTRNVLAALTSREDVPEHILLLIQSHLAK
ncbi:unnamed protein product [marine sediment metagenome]|uniref:Uncharacterized protein n=1 Tax=marine sediment metagenome TaxID=412755 RepID=X0YTF9_9ZZZZ